MLIIQASGVSLHIKAQDLELLTQAPLGLEEQAQRVQSDPKLYVKL